MADAAAAPDFVMLVGPPYLGWILNIFLCGILTVQVYVYYMAFSKDQWALKAIVYTVFVLEVAQTVMKTYDRFQTSVKSYVNPGILDNQLTSWFSIPVLTAVTSGIVQGFFGFRIYVFSKSWMWASLVWVCMLIQVGSGVTQGVLSAPLARSEIAAHTKIPAVTWVISTMVTDVLIAVLLSYYLSRLKSGIHQTDKLITKIVRLTVETGTATAVWAILILILFFHMPLWMFIFSDSLGKIYSNNLLIMFNRRIEFKAHGGRSLQSAHRVTDNSQGHTDSVPTYGIRVQEATMQFADPPTSPSKSGFWDVPQGGKVVYEGNGSYMLSPTRSANSSAPVTPNSTTQLFKPNQERGLGV